MLIRNVRCICVLQEAEELRKQGLLSDEELVQLLMVFTRALQCTLAHDSLQCLERSIDWL